ncbi:MAG: outer membrane protein assembly factor BamD [Amoebophilaceae bacterium]|nr:outer membrane protein assembly factor BamD [Amoebophilaceae bacterium]
MNPSAAYIFFLVIIFFQSNGLTLLASPVEVVHSSLFLKKKKQIIHLYQQKRYTKANALIEELLPLVDDKLEGGELHFYQAYCKFYNKDYLSSSDQFHGYVKKYPCALQTEEAVFMRGYSLACKDVDIRLDQKVTYDAIRCISYYLTAYPTGTYIEQAQDALQRLQSRLMRKDFAACCSYMQLGYWHAAVVTLKIFQQTYPDTLLKKEVLSLLVKSYRNLAMETSNEADKQKMKTYVEQFSKQLKSLSEAENSSIIQQPSI